MTTQNYFWSVSFRKTIKLKRQFFHTLNNLCDYKFSPRKESRDTKKLNVENFLFLFSKRQLCEFSVNVNK